MRTLSLFAYHDTIDTADGVKRKFADLNRDTYPDQVYQYILDHHIETETPVIDVIGWCCSLMFTPIDDAYYDEVSRDSTVIHNDDAGAWHIQ